MTMLAVGTDDGFFLIGEDSEKAWKIGFECLEGYEVLGLARGASNTILAATRGQGLNRIDLESGSTKRMAASDLPDMLHCVTVSPHDPQMIYVGSEPAGMYVSQDGGSHFAPLAAVARLNQERRWTYPIPTIATHIRHIVVDMDEPSRLYAAVQVGGFIRSEDAGASWDVLDAGLDPDVHAILQHPTRHELIYAVCGGGGGDDADPEHKSGRPIYRSRDLGKTWHCVSGDFVRTYGAPVGVLSGAQPILLAGVARGIPPSWRKRPERADSAVMLSQDDGETWQAATSELDAHRKMFEAICTTMDNRVFIGTGIDVGAARGAPEAGGEIYVAATVRGPWERLPIDLPGVATMMCL